MSRNKPAARNVINTTAPAQNTPRAKLEAPTTPVVAGTDPREEGQNKAKAAPLANRPSAAKPLADESHLPTPEAAPVISRRAVVKQVQMVSVTVPKAFTLNDDSHVKHNYSTGVQDMDVEHAEHPYAVAHGVEINE